ncbi:MAG: YeeE/YedE family protein [Saprospiraceae bacterium]|nr:YeeE/YedE family protein [Saprospiraceae bacterium]
MLELLKSPWHWSVAGLMIGLTVPILLILGNKKFGISSSMRHVCAICIPANIPYFKYDWKKEIWNLFFVGGILIGGFIAAHFLSNDNSIIVADATRLKLDGYGITDYHSLLPSDLFNWDNLFTLRGLVFFVLGGFFVGFGTRYAGGCTSGHSIMGLSSLQLPSLIATISFMVGGFLSANLIMPFIFQLLK